MMMNPHRDLGHIQRSHQRGRSGGHRRGGLRERRERVRPLGRLLRAQGGGLPRPDPSPAPMEEILLRGHHQDLLELPV